MSRAFGATTDEVLEGIDLSGKRILVAALDADHAMAYGQRAKR